MNIMAYQSRNVLRLSLTALYNIIALHENGSKCNHREYNMKKRIIAFRDSRK